MLSLHCCVGFSLVSASGGYSTSPAVLGLLIVVASLVAEPELQGTQAALVLAHGLSSCGYRALECRLSSCGTRAWLVQGMWGLPGSGIEALSPALTGRFFTTEEQGNCVSHSVLSSLRPHGLWPTRLLCPWNSLGKNTGAIPFSRGSSRHRDPTCVSCITGRFFTSEPPGKQKPNITLKCTGKPKNPRDLLAYNIHFIAVLSEVCL